MRKLLTVCLCGCCPGRLVSFVFDGGSAAEAGVDAAVMLHLAIHSRVKRPLTSDRLAMPQAA